MILAVGVRLVFGVPFQGVPQFRWISAAYVCAAIVVLHPVMDKDLPLSVGSDMLKSLRTYIGAAYSSQPITPPRAVNPANLD
jgi:hypothetical protein